MSWYAAHIIQYVKFLDGKQDKYPFLENIVLVEAEDSDTAWDKAEEIGQTHYGTNEGSDNGSTYEGRPCARVFGGIRKLIECENIIWGQPDNDDPEFKPTTGTEITYSFMEVDSEEAFNKLLEGEPVNIFYEE